MELAYASQRTNKDAVGLVKSLDTPTRTAMFSGSQQTVKHATIIPMVVTAFMLDFDHPAAILVGNFLLSESVEWLPPDR